MTEQLLTPRPQEILMGDELSNIYARAIADGVVDFIPSPKEMYGSNLPQWIGIREYNRKSRHASPESSEVADRIEGCRPQVAEMRTRAAERRITNGAYEQFRTCFIYNRPNVDIHAPENKGLLIAAEQYAENNRPLFLLPYHQEADTAWQAVTHASRFGTVMPMCTGKGEPAIQAMQEVRDMGHTTWTQTEVFQALKFPDTFQNYTGIPITKRTPESIIEEQRTGIPIVEGLYAIPGAKGVTLEAAIIAAYLQGELDDDNRIVFAHDTDIINPEQYAAPEHLLAALAYSPDYVQSGGILRTGVGRNTETNTFVASQLANQLENPDLRAINAIMSRLGWPLTGEFFDRAGNLKARANMAGMGIETFRNADLAARMWRDGQINNIQVANPNPKMENGASPSYREFQVIYGCAYNHQILMTFCEDQSITPDIFGTVEGLPYLKLWNETIAGKITADFTVPVHETHDAPEIITVSPDYIMPSIDQLVHLGVLPDRRAH